MIKSQKNRIQAEILYEEAMKLREKRLFSKAIDKLSEAIRLLPDNGPILGVLAATYWDMKDLPNAIKFFEKSVGILPASERASLGLFHTRIEVGDVDSAFAEMKRFLAISSSEEYSRLLQEINEES